MSRGTRVDNNVASAYDMVCLEFDWRLTGINHVIVVASTTAGLIYWAQFDWAITVICSVVFLIVHGGLFSPFLFCCHNGQPGKIPCVRHKIPMKKCPECIKLHGCLLLRKEHHAKLGN